MNLSEIYTIMIRIWGKQLKNQENSEILRNNLKNFREYARIDFGSTTVLVEWDVVSWKYN